MSQLAFPVINVSGERVVVDNQPLVVDAIQTFVTTDTTAAVGSLVVKNTGGFAVNKILLIGELKNQGSEIIKTHASTAPTSNTITLAANTVYPHSSGTPVYLVDYDQVALYTNTTNSSVGVTALSTPSVQPQFKNTIYNDTAGSTGFYLARYFNSINATYSNYSSPVPIAGYGTNTARYIIDSALGMIGKETSELLNDKFFFREINNCQLECLRELKRWSFMQVFDSSLGQISQGSWKVAVPSNMDDQNTNRSVYNFKIGTMDNLIWVDKEKWNEITFGVAHTTLAVSIATGTTAVWLTDASNFNSTGGTLYIGAHTYAYSAISGNQVTVTSTTTTDTSGTDVFTGASFGTPLYWTTFGGNLYFYPVLGSTYNNQEGILDYYKTLTTIVNDSDTIVLPDSNVIQYYLAWKALLRIQSGRDDATTQAMYAQYLTRRERMKQKETLGRTFRLKPIVNTLDENMSGDDRQTRLGNFPNTFS